MERTVICPVLLGLARIDIDNVMSFPREDELQTRQAAAYLDNVQEAPMVCHHPVCPGVFVSSCTVIGLPRKRTSPPKSEIRIGQPRRPPDRASFGSAPLPVP